jgi:hypothetical protein
MFVRFGGESSLNLINVNLEYTLSCETAAPKLI